MPKADYELLVKQIAFQLLDNHQTFELVQEWLDIDKEELLEVYEQLRKEVNPCN